MKNVQYLLFLAFTSFFISCDDGRVFEENTDIKGFDWFYENEISFNVDIADLTKKNILINFRHTPFFESRNVLLKVKVKNPKGEETVVNVNIPLSEPNGVWYGECTGNICDIQHPLDYNITEIGKYTFTLIQDMRTDPLYNTMSVGLRIENISNKEENE